MWLILIIGVGLGLMIATTIQAWILQLAFKIATKETPTFGDAFKTCLVAMIAGFLVSLGLWQTEMNQVLQQVLGVCAGIIVYTIVISMFIATELKQALIISIIMAGLGWLLTFILQLSLAGMTPATG